MGAPERRKQRIEDAIQQIGKLRKVIAEDDQHIDYLAQVLDRMKWHREEKRVIWAALREDLAQLYLQDGAVLLEIHDPAFPGRIGAIPGVRIVVSSYSEEGAEVLVEKVFRRKRDDFFEVLQLWMGAEQFNASMVLRALMYEGVISSDQRIVLNKELYFCHEDTWVLVELGV